MTITTYDSVSREKIERVRIRLSDEHDNHVAAVVSWQHGDDRDALIRAAVEAMLPELINALE
ncbi:MAG: hypothetical protein ACR2PM_00655 [Hyphomicrobiales bacterium]